jgi:hypothetical protein
LSSGYISEYIVCAYVFMCVYVFEYVSVCICLLCVNYINVSKCVLCALHLRVRKFFVLDLKYAMYSSLFSAALRCSSLPNLKQVILHLLRVFSLML